MWMTASMPRITSCTAPTSRMSPRTSSTRGSASAASTLERVPRSRLSRMTMRPGRWCSSRRSMVVEPTSPQPPVTRMRAPSMFMSTAPSDPPRWIPRDSRTGRYAAYHVASEPHQGALADGQAVHDAGAAPDVAVRADRRAARDRHVGTDERPGPDHHVVVDDGVRHDADVVADHRVAGDHHAGHHEDVPSEDRERRDARGGMDDAGEALRRDVESRDDAPPLAVRCGASGHGEHVRVAMCRERVAAEHAEAVRAGPLLLRRVVDEAQAVIRVAQAVEGLDAVPIAGEDQEGPGVPRGRIAHGHGSQAPMRRPPACTSRAPRYRPAPP